MVGPAPPCRDGLEPGAGPPARRHPGQPRPRQPVGRRANLTVAMQPTTSDPGITRCEPDLAEQLWTAALQETDPLPADPDAFLAALAERQRTIKRRPAPVWQQRAVLVDGRPVAFTWLAEGRHWVACGVIGEVLVTMEARDVPSTRWNWSASPISSPTSRAPGNSTPPLRTTTPDPLERRPAPG
jgi:hypothetical protein